MVTSSRSPDQSGIGMERPDLDQSPTNCVRPRLLPRGRGDRRARSDADWGWRSHRYASMPTRFGTPFRSSDRDNPQWIARHRQVESLVRSRRSNISRRKAATRSGAVMRPSAAMYAHRVGQIAQHCVAQQTGQGGVLVDHSFGRRPLETHDDQHPPPLPPSTDVRRRCRSHQSPLKQISPMWRRPSW